MAKKQSSTPKDISAIPTVYAGIQLRSRFEAQVAQLIECMGWKWEYEKYSFALPGGINYMPDFYLPECRSFVEARGYRSSRGADQIMAFGKGVSAETIEIPGIGKPDWYMIIGPARVGVFDRFAHGLECSEVSPCEACGQWTPIAHGNWREDNPHYGRPCPGCGETMHHCNPRSIEVRAGRVLVDECEIDAWIAEPWTKYDISVASIKERLECFVSVLTAAEYSGTLVSVDWSKAPDGDAVAALGVSETMYDWRMKELRAACVLAGLRDEEVAFQRAPRNA